MSEQQTFSDNWWIEGDAPVRSATRAAFLIDGRLTMLEMCVRFVGAKHSISIAAWGLTPDLLLVRGKHHRAGPDGSPEQKTLLDWLCSKGMEKVDLLFWQRCQGLSVANVLNYAVSKGVEVRVLLWDTYSLIFPTDARKVHAALESLGVRCLLDDSHMSILNHPAAALHQKAVVVDSQYAFVGGIDMMTEGNGEYDRWDTKGHIFQNLLRLRSDGKMPHGWHDVHLKFEGPAVADVELNFRQRWNAVAQLHELGKDWYLPEPPEQANTTHASIIRPPEHTVGELRIQMTRTIPNRIYNFAPDGIATILESYQRAFANARHFIYIENQYFWRRTFLGLENPALGIPHADMEKLIATLADAIGRGVVVTLLLPDNPNVGREFTDEGLQYLWELCPDAVMLGSLAAYTLGTFHEEPVQDEAGETLSNGERSPTNNRMRYRPIYVHGKVALVDDMWITVGSANLNNRGMRDDAELNMAIVHPRMAQALRMLLMAEHLGLCDEDTLFRIIEVMGQVRLTDELEHVSEDIAAQWEILQEQLHDPFASIGRYALQAKENLQAVKEHRTLVGHLLPYIPHYRAQDYQVELDPVNGWLDTLPKPPQTPPVEVEQQS